MYITATITTISNYYHRKHKHTKVQLSKFYIPGTTITQNQTIYTLLTPHH